jgi:hypothetical protein
MCNQDHGNIEDPQTNNCPEDMIPNMGMKFNSEQVAYDFCNSYTGSLGIEDRFQCPGE